MADEIPVEIQELLDEIELDGDEEELDERLAEMWPIILLKYKKSVINRNWNLWSQAWSDVVEGGFIKGEEAVGGALSVRPRIQYFMDHGLELVKGLSETDLKTLKSSMLDNWGIGEVAFKEKFQEDYSVRVDKIYRTEFVKACAEGTIVTAKNVGFKFKQWRCPNDERSCEACSALDYEVVGIDEDFSAGVNSPGLHPQCRCVLLTLMEEDDAFEGEVESVIMD